LRRRLPPTIGTAVGSSTRDGGCPRRSRFVPPLRGRRPRWLPAVRPHRSLSFVIVG